MKRNPDNNRFGEAFKKKIKKYTAKCGKPYSIHKWKHYF